MALDQLDNFDEVLRSAKNGNDLAFSVIYRHYYQSLEKYAHFKSPRYVDEITGETWLGVVEGLSKFEGGEREFRSWLFTIARNKLVDILKKKRPELVEFSEKGEVTGEEGDGGDIVGEEIVTREQVKEVINFIRSSLNPDEAEVIILRVLMGFDGREVASLMGLREVNVRVLQHRGLHKLAQRVAKAPPGVFTNLTIT